MAGKEVPLSIVLRTVDKATAGITAVNKRLDELTKPTREFGKALSELGEKSGLNTVVGAVKNVGGAIAGLVGKVALIGGAVGAAVAGVLSLVDHFDALGDTAERLGTSADFLAAFRFAAERAGAPIEGLDESLQTLVTNMGAAKAGTGRMLKFLNQISPAFAKQVTSANSLEEALGLIADAAAKLPDAARRSKLAAATLGNERLAPLLARGAAGVQELLTEFHGLAGNLGDATEAAGKTDDAMKRMHASVEGVKAALVTGLAPALTIIIEKLTAWFVAHRADVAAWAEQIGRELPAAVDQVVKSISGALEDVTSLVEALGGWKVAAGAVALVMTGPLLSAVATLSAALLATPFGWFLTSIALVAAAITDVIKHWNDLDILRGDFRDKVFAAAEKERREKGKAPDVLTDSIIPRDVLAKISPLPAVQQAAAAIPAHQARIQVDFIGMPKGARATIDPRSDAAVDLTVGHQMGGF